MFEFLAVKRFKRSGAAEANMNDPIKVRPPNVLYMTMMYLIEVLMD